MTKKELAEALEEVRNQPEIGERVKQDAPQDIPAFWAEVLAEKGYTVSSEEIASFIREAEEERRKMTAGKIEELPDQEVEEAAGGFPIGDCNILPKCEQTSNTCNSTYEDYENCWWNDGCDKVVNYYPDYKCKSDTSS